ncbi:MULTISPECIES: (Fe-S)-binding protein [Actinomadura]|uniref:Glycolate oxidase iron-sulfur subunit n=1 Tax=Actinomadura litoris TaxID=2678616 RepID=A0A7K1L6S9_9ACTN|nr:MULTISPECIES: heterodisulfide reductase-related iron-sulfur binding cluster [Actinomadura]MBT2209431.1 4Fe-4S dicluster domain-containing protein [Actinomadura sp. NEAU-AAG7]MUN40122.1 4Fe-4S dicluster domain-containing protein [Actinomadura litoris]
MSADNDLPKLLDDCVHCGFCLPTCPTYVLWGEEMDSPRGRIHLMAQHEEGAPLSGPMVEHFDRCLGCMACVTACPSGVQYDRLIEMTRAEVEREHPRPFQERVIREAIFRLFPYRRRLRALRGPLRAYQRTGLDRLVRRTGLLERLSPSLAAMERLAPPLGRAPRLPERVGARGGRRATVGMLTGCVQSEFFPGVNAATARVLALEGCDVVIPRAQGCCGALSLHAGREEEARAFARRTVATFEHVDVIVVNAAGCGSAMKEYEALLAADPAWSRRAAALAGRTRDLAEFLVELGPRAERHPLPVTLAYHDACHLSHAQGIRSQPRALLAAVPELKVREIADPEICCGSAGTYNLLQPEAAAELGERKAVNVDATGAELLVAANPGCSMQIATALRRRGTDIAVAHTAQVLDASLRGLGREALVKHGS